jgi:hypothetical protein
MIANASIDAIVVPWDGPSTTNDSTSFTDRSMKLLFKHAPTYGVKIVPLFQPADLSYVTMRSDFEYYKRNYLNEKAHAKIGGLPVGLMYDAHRFKDSARFLDQTPEMVFLASALSYSDFLAAFEDGYRGFATFFASDQASWASSHDNWKQLSEISKDRGMLFVPGVSPGYNDAVIERWNTRWHRARNCSSYYDERWRAAIESRGDIVMVNSFNLWPEGSVIEPVIDHENYTLNDNLWCGTDPEYFLLRTAKWAREFKRLVVTNPGR